jgi:hypothetical protein
MAAKRSMSTSEPMTMPAIAPGGKGFLSDCVEDVTTLVVPGEVDCMVEDERIEDELVAVIGPVNVVKRAELSTTMRTWIA